MGFRLIDFDVIFPIQSSEFIKSLNFGSNLKKTAKKNSIFLFFSKKLIFIDKEIYSLVEIGHILIDLN